MKLETFVHVLAFEKLKERLKNDYGTEALVTASRTSENRFTINVYLEYIFLDKDIAVFMKFNVDVDNADLLKFSANEFVTTMETTEIGRASCRERV